MKSSEISKPIFDFAEEETMEKDAALPRWSLKELFPSPDGVEMLRAFKELDRRVAALEKKRHQLTPRISSAAFLGWLKELEEVRSLARRVAAYAELWFAENTQDTAAITFYGNTEQRLAELENRLLFFSTWWKELPKAAAGRLLARSGPYRYYLEQVRRVRPHTLPEGEEKVVNLKNATGSRALVNVYNSITNRYQFEWEVDGVKKNLTRGELSVYFRSAQPEQRAAAYQSLYAVYGRDGAILGQIYSALVRDWRSENVILRKFSIPIAARNLANDLPDRVVRLLLEVCQANASVFQRFFTLKARTLGLPRLRRYDLYAPVATSEKKYEFGEAWDLVRKSLERFDPSFAELAGKVLRENHLDSDVRPGKREGAFCLSALPALTPWVLTNYQSRVYDLATLAHELGHAVHSLLASGNPLLTFEPSLPLAETASTFSEMLLVDSLLKEEKDEAVRRDLLFRQMDDSYATIMRQAFFALFEVEAHELVGKGASIEDLCQRYYANLEKQFGDALEVSEDFRWEWVAIPHIYEVPFYVYAYAFGQLLVLALFNQYKTEGSSFVPRFERILSAGGSASPARILARAGIRIDQESFWQGGFDLLVRQLDQLR
jgi:oligoendopeptidase F